MRRLIPFLLITAIGVPIWLVYNSGAENPGYAPTAPYGQTAYQGQNGVPGTALPTWSASPNTVYSQSSYPNPAPSNRNFGQMNYSPTGTAIPTTPQSEMAPATMLNPGLNPMSNGAFNPGVMQNPGYQPGMPPVIGGNPPVASPYDYGATTAPAQFGTLQLPMFSNAAGQSVPGQPTYINNSQLIPGHAVGSQTIVFRGDASGPDLTTVPMEFMPTQSLAEIFRFDVDQSWIRNRWDRVSTSPGETGLHGLRVPLVTGTNRTDLHGSLTYYFDSSQRLQRITFRGWTGDSKPLIDLLAQTYGFKPQRTNAAGLYVADNRHSAVGALLLQLPTVIRAANSGQQESLDLEINNPDGRFLLSDQFRVLLSSQ